MENRTLQEQQLLAWARGGGLLKPAPAANGAVPVNLPRRGFLRGAGAVTLGSLALAACGGGGGDDANAATPAPVVGFLHGIASGDPLADRVMLWTRVSTAAAQVSVDWEVARDAGFADIVARGSAVASAEADHTVKVDAAGLEPGMRYFYRFRSGGTTSPAGRTRTAATGPAASLRMAVFSCANYSAGHFNVYAEAVRRDDFDLSVHLGDYLYEYGRGAASPLGPGREVLPAHETVSLADYRARYAQYRGDADLQALHAAAPMVAVWDDHEFANDAWRDGAQNHQDATEGSFATRRAAAMQAWHEWLPTRVSAPDVIYRSFDFGNLVSLHMLDTRIAGRQRQLDRAAFIGAGGVDAPALFAAANDPARQLLGAAQTEWLRQRIAGSGATWQIIGQQVLMARLVLPAPILLRSLAPDLATSLSIYLTLQERARSAPGSLTPEEQAVLAQPWIPASLDVWDGYGAAREAVLEMARSGDKNLVVLAGDSHNAWGSNLADAAGRAVGVEFAAPSVTSPGAGIDTPAQDAVSQARLLEQLLEPLQYAERSRHGYLQVTASASECRCDWIFVDTITRRGYSAVVDHSLRVLPGAANRTLVAV